MTVSKLLCTSILCAWVLIMCQTPETSADAEALYTGYCGSCHAVPDIQHLPERIWEENILPDMAARLGYRYGGYDPLGKYSMEEGLYIRLTGAYPANASIDSVTWVRLHQWIVDQAPESIPIDTMRGLRHVPLDLFSPEPISIDTVSLATITYVDFVEEENTFVVGDAFGNISRLPSGQPLDLKCESPIMTYEPGDQALVTEIGFMNPSDRAWGKVHLWDGNRLETIVEKLKRPVYSAAEDLNGDGILEVLVCEFGNYGGQLSLIVRENGDYIKKTLLPVPGTVKFEVVDMNGDGRKDIVVLAAQGNEGIYILYQADDFSFRTRQVIRLGPEYGSSWFEMVDYDGDGDLDIAYANGDNADNSVFLKPYHGVRLFENEGNDQFSEKWFYPIYGATRILPADYDQDGDIDFAVMSFFPDFGGAYEEGFVFLENKSTENLDFDSYTFEGARDGRWLVMDRGDIDGDGDLDLLLGAFMLYPGAEYRDCTDRWQAEGVDLYLLRNNTFQ